MAGSATIPTWLELFGTLDTKDADPGLLRTAPAAYLADLLQLLYDRFDTTDFTKRRPDIASQIKLNGDQSFTLKRQLDIVNGLLGDRISSQQNITPADAVLAAAQQPFLLPFEYQHERIRQILLLLRTPYRDLYSSFASQVDVDVLARERLGLSPARAATIVQDLAGDKQNSALRTVSRQTSSCPFSSISNGFVRPPSLMGLRYVFCFSRS